MKIRTKFTVMAGIPIAAIIIIILAVGLVSFTRIKTMVSDVGVIQADRATMIDADRDAYQAYLAQVEAAGSLNKEAVEAQAAWSDSSSKSNRRALW